MNDDHNGRMKRELLHVDLIRRVSTDHVQHGESATRMLVEPSVQSKDSALGDDDGIAFRNLGLNLSTTENSITTHCRLV